MRLKQLKHFGASRRGGGHGECPAGAGKMRRHQGKIAEGEEGDATPDLLLKHQGKTFAIYIWRQMKHLKHASETLAEEPVTLEKPLQSIRNIQIKHLQHMCETYATSKETHCNIHLKKINETFEIDACNIHV